MQRWVTVCGMAALGVFVGGCNAGQAQRESRVRQALRAPLDDDIIKVITYYPNNPFMSFDEAGDPNPEGIKLVYYAVSARTKEGAYGDGLIRIKMYVVDYAHPEEPTGILVRTWEFTPQQALGWRVAHKPRLGWPYQFHLNWGDADVYDREIRIVPEFVRNDGQVVRGSTKSLRVPPRRNAVRLIDSANQPPS